MGNGAALATTEQKTGGIMDMSGGMSGEMAARLNEMKLKLSMVQNFMKEVMDVGFDYGIIPGTDKPCLFKPGAEKMLNIWGFSSRIIDKKGNDTRDEKTGYYLAEITVQIAHIGSGTIVAEGVGECCSFESKYRYRWLFENELPKGMDKTGLVSKTFESKAGKEYTKYRVENMELVDQWNTILKMAHKRALVGATLTATGTSGIFNQTSDEMDEWIDNEGDNRLQKKEPLQKKKWAPTAADEKSSFNPSASGGMITIAQKNKIQYDAEKKKIKLEDIEKIIISTNQKPINELTKAEASAVIEWLSKVSNDDLQDLVVDIAMNEMGGGKS